MKLSKLAQAVTLLTYTRKAFGANLGGDTKYPEGVRCSAEPIQASTGLAPEIIPRPQPYPSEEALVQLVEATYQLQLPINHLKGAKVQEVVNDLNPKKSSLHHW
jgi:hypothetical protein